MPISPLICNPKTRTVYELEYGAYHPIVIFVHWCTVTV